MKLILFFIVFQLNITKILKKYNFNIEKIWIKSKIMDFYGGDKYRLNLHKTLMKSPDLIFSLTEKIKNNLERENLSERELLGTMEFLLNKNVRRDLIENKLKNYWKEIKIDKKLKNLPLKIQKPIAYFLFCLKKIDSLLEYSYKKIDIKKTKKLIIPYFFEEDNFENISLEIEGIIDNIDFHLLNAAGTDFILMSRELVDSLKKIKEIDKDYIIDTEFGKIYLCSNKGTKVEIKDAIFVFDAGGNDTFLIKDEFPKKFFFFMDSEGDDYYSSDNSLGSGIFSLSYFNDLKGNDEYIFKNFGCGAGIFGISVFIDNEGNDRYNGYVFGEGAGAFGIGILWDKKGNDYYHIYQLGQGFGYTLGAGLLIDNQGNDRYIGEDKDIKFPSPQTKKHNANLVQGFGYGLRADYTTGHSLAGGIGILFDKEGDDAYSAGLFAQGCGYWYGTGILIDKKGNDNYKGIWYVQGAGAHFAIGILEDEEGADSFKAEINMAQGAGHDFSIGVLVDKNGNDYHFSPNLSLGAGNAQGIGIFVDLNGDDIYQSKKGVNLGMGNSKIPIFSFRNLSPTTGIFIDFKGKDKYIGKRGKNNSKWIQKTEKKEFGIGIDY